MNKVILSCCGKDGGTIISFDISEEATWSEYIDHFNRFLSGIGYISQDPNGFVEPLWKDKGME